MTVTFVDGLVVARSTYNTDINYRSVVIIGQATEVKDLDEKRRGLELMVDHIIPGRSRDARPPTEKELRSTMLLRLPLASPRPRSAPGGRSTRRRTTTSTIWAGVIPFTTVDRAGPGRPGPARRRPPCPTTWSATDGPSPSPRRRNGGADRCAASSGSSSGTPALEPRLGSLLVPDDRGPRRARPRLLGHRRLRRPPTPSHRTGPPPLRVSLGADVAVDWMAGRLRAARPVRQPGPTSHRFGAGLVVDVRRGRRCAAVAAAARRGSGPRCGCSAPAGTSAC